MVILPVRHGFAMLDADVAEWAAAMPLRRVLRHRKWDGMPAGYVGYGRLWLHRAILPGDGVVIHLNGWGMDCRRENLLLTTLAMASREHRRDRGSIFTSRTGFRVVHRNRSLGKFPTRAEAQAAKRAAEQADGIPPLEDRAALLAPVLKFLEAEVAAGRLCRGTTGAPLIEDRFRVMKLG